MASDKYQISAIIKVFDEASGPMQKIGKGMAAASERMSRAGEKMNQWGNTLTTRVTLPIMGALGMAVKYASDTEESLNKVSVAFGDSAGQVTKFADSTLKSFGIARQSALDAAATFGDMATSMGLNQQQAADMSTSLVGLAGDLASFKNIPVAQAMTALGGIFTGETESLKRLGVVMIDANVKAFALKQGITKSYESMTQAEKVSLRYRYILEQTKNSQGDFARTSDGAANQTRIFTESLKQTSETFGRILLPTVTRVLQKLNQLVEWIGTFDEDTKELILTTVLVVAALGPVLKIMGTLIKVIQLARSATLLFNAALFANPLMLLVMGIAAVSYAIYKLIFDFQAVLDAAKSFWNFIRENDKSLKMGPGKYEEQGRVKQADIGLDMDPVARRILGRESKTDINLTVTAKDGAGVTVDGIKKKSGNSNVSLNTFAGRVHVPAIAGDRRG